ncbi:hypothetical protein RPHASCH2410_CH01430 [Rhizobium phaseoli Ch24-10]|nr:hypothetical protein RPHASCH2410_CH01430 [Rhizobium phaseoli Ch24-10]
MQDTEGDPHMSRSNRSHVNDVWNVSVIALVVVLAGLLYVFGAAMSGDSIKLTESVRGAEVFDTRNLP